MARKTCKWGGCNGLVPPKGGTCSRCGHVTNYMLRQGWFEDKSAASKSWRKTLVAFVLEVRNSEHGFIDVWITSSMAVRLHSTGIVKEPGEHWDEAFGRAMDMAEEWVNNFREKE